MLTYRLSPGEQEPLPQAVQRDASGSGVTGVDILISLGVVELFNAGGDDPISGRWIRRSRWKAGLYSGP